MRGEERIKLSDNFLSVVTKLSDGNPDAVNAMMMMSNCNCDPDDFMGPMGSLLSLDSHGIYGSDIYVLFSDICEKNPVKACAVLRSVQLGIFEESVLKDACGRQDYSGRDLVEVEELYKKVKERLPNFDPKNEGAV